HPLAELGVLVEEPREQLRREPEERALVDRLHRRGPRLPENRGALAEEVALAEVREIALDPGEDMKRPQPAVLDHVHRPGRIALADDVLAWSRGDLFEPGDELGQRLVRQDREGAVEAEEVRQRPGAREPLEGPPDLRVRARERGEDAAVEAENLG